MDNRLTRVRWAAVGAAVAVTLGAGGLQLAGATIGSGERAVYVAITPCRLFNTRPAPANVGPRTSPLGTDDTYSVPATGPSGNCNLPAAATAVVMTLTAVDQTATTFITVWPADQARPSAASLTVSGSAAGATSTAVTSRLSSTGQISLFNKNGSVNVIGDIVGYYEDHHHDDRYYTKAQVDTKITDAGGDYWGAINANGTPVTGSHSGNFTVQRMSAGKYCVLVPKATAAGEAIVATLNYEPGETITGYRIVTTTRNGSHCNGVSTATHDAIPVITRKLTDNTPVDALFNFYIPRK
jgi:hypothetical protein